MNIEREWCWYQMCSVGDVGPATINKLMEYAGGLEEALEMTTDEVRESHICSAKMLAGWNKAKLEKRRIREEFEHLESRGMRFVSIEHEDYPGKLRDLKDAPFGIWVKGRLPVECKPCASIIGSRGCTSHGLELARDIGKKLAGIGVQVVSGMALGIDAAGQWGALDAGGYSLGVLGSGVDVCYPRDNIDLYETLTQSGGLLSEKAPGTPGLPAFFRLRNRLISGLSDCVIVVEAREKSGTQITVSCALDQGREVFCVPGRMTDPLSCGCNQMISQGARILYDFSELADFFDAETECFTNDAKTVELSELEGMVYARLTDEPKHFEEVLNETCLPVGELMEILLRLEMKGVVYQQVKNYYRKCLSIQILRQFPVAKTRCVSV